LPRLKPETICDIVSGRRINKMDRLLRKASGHMSFVKPFLEWLVNCEVWMARRWVSNSHKRLMAVQWGVPPQPEHFDHHIDLFYQWLATGNPHTISQFNK